MSFNEPGQTSLINWLQKMGGEESLVADILKYDNEKTERLETLGRLINLPTNHTDYVPADEFAAQLESLRAKRGNVPLAFRIAPKESHAGAFEIIKKYGVTLGEFATFLNSSSIERSMAMIRITDFRPKLSWSAVFVVSEQGIVGEIVNGTLYILTYGSALHENEQVSQFFQTKDGVLTTNGTSDTQQKMRDILSHVRVQDVGMQEALRTEGFSIANDNICGYYEYVEGDDGSRAFTDMNNKVIATNIDVASAISKLQQKPEGGNIRGLCAYDSKSTARGVVHNTSTTPAAEFVEGAVLVTPMTSVNDIALMQKSVAIVTDSGGIMSHAAIVAREMKKPCIVGTKVATQMLRTGDVVEVESSAGIVRIVEKR